MPEQGYLRKGRGRARVRAVVLACAGLLISAALTARQGESNYARARSKFHEAAQRVSDEVHSRLSLYEYGLRGARGVVLTASADLSRGSFLRYARSRDLSSEFPGARGFGFIRRVARSDEDAFLSAAREDTPGFTIRELSPHEGERWVIQYVEPEASNREAVGLDIASEARRRDAAAEALRTGRATLTAPITLVQATAFATRSFLLLLPVYPDGITPSSVSEREQRAIGFSYAPLLIDEVLRGLDLGHEEIWLALSDEAHTESEGPFFQSSERPTSALTMHIARPLYGRVWRMDLAATPRFIEELHLLAPSRVFALGVVVSALLSVLLYVYLVSQQRSLWLRQQEARLSNLVENSSDAIIAESLDGVITAWNEAAQRIFGYTVKEALGQKAESLALTETAPSERAQLLRARQGEHVAPFDAVRPHRDGTLRDVSIALSPIRSHDGTVIGVGKTLRDVSDKKQAERKLQEFNASLEEQVSARVAELEESQRRLRAASRENDALLSTLHKFALVSVTDRSGIIIEANDEFCRVSGYAREELLGQSHNVINSGVHPKSFWTEMWQTIAAGKLWRAEVCNRRKDGSLYYVDSFVMPFFDDSGRIERYVSIRTDLTERRTALQDLARERERLDNIVRGTNAGTWEWNVQTGETRVNERWAEMIGMRLEDFGRIHIETWLSLIQPEDLVGVQAALRRHFSGETDFYEGEYRLRHQDGSWVWALDRGCVFTWTADGKPEWMYGTHQDVTERHAAEDALRSAMRSAEAASAAKSEFLANVSHEIRTPLNAVIGMSYLLERTPLSREQSEYLRKIQTSGRLLLGVINDVLDLSKIEAGEMTLEDVTFDLSAVLDELRQMFGSQAQQKGLTLRITDVPELARKLRGDATRLTQILANLISNALKFTERGEVSLALCAEARAAGQVQLRCTVRDTGVGIADEALPHLFAPFTQADASTTRRFGGTGLGLSIVKRLSEMMGGRVGVSSQLGVGSEFWVELVLSAGEGAEISHEQRLVVLFVHEGEAMRTALCESARELGWQAFGVASSEALGTELRALAQQGHDVDVLVLTHGEVRDPPAPEPGAVLAGLGFGSLPATLILDETSHAASNAEGCQMEALSAVLSSPIALFEAVSRAVRARYGSPWKVLRATRLEALDGSLLASVRVLLVDDSEINIDVARAILMHEGAEVVACGNGADALAALQKAEGAFDVVLMDVQMPIMDGNEATRRLRKELGLTNLPVIALTAGALVAERQRALAAGMNDFLTKPIDPEALVRSVRFYAEHARGVPLPVSPRVRSLPAPKSWPPIEGIDADDAARRVLGDRDLFLSMLSRTLREFGEGDPLSTATLAVDPEGAKTLQMRVHKLRGSAGMLGALRVHELAGALEDALEEGRPASDLSALSSALCAALEQLRTSALPVIERHAAAQHSTATAASGAPADGELAELLAALSRQDLSALQKFHELAPLLRTRYDAANYQKLQRAVDDLDFAEAEALLAAIPPPAA